MDLKKEKERIAKLRNLEIMDSPPEAILDSIVKLASDICGTPISLVSLVDDHRQWFKAKHGLSACETPKEFAFCSHAIESDDPFVINDSRLDERFKDNPLVKGEPHVIFYAGIPLKVSGDHNIGTLCVIDHEPRELSDQQISQLKILAKQAAGIIETRKQLLVSKKLSAMLTKLNELEFETCDSINSIFQKYLQTGSKLYGLEFGIISKVDGNDYTVFSAVSPGNELSDGANFALQDTYCDAVLKTKKTVTYDEVGKIENLKGHPVYVNMKLESYISTPIWFDGKIFGTLNFSSHKPRKSSFLEEERRFIELLADSISKRMLAEEKARKLNYSFQIMNESPDYIGMVDFESGKILFHNKALNSMSGKSSNGDNTIADCHPKWVGEKIANEGIPKIIETGVWTDESALLDSYGNEIPVLQTIVGHYDMFGKLVNLSTIMQNIEKQKEIENNLREARKKAEQANNLKSEFLASVSHEIRTPLNGALGILGLLNNTELTEKQQDYINSIHTCGEDLLIILNDILDLSKIESDRLEIENAEFNLETAINESVKLYQQKAKEKGNSIITEGLEAINTNFLGDRVRVKQIICNFISNATKFTVDGKIKVIIEFSQLQGNNAKLKISVEDTGIGISAHRQKGIFSPYEQEEKSTTREYGGTGLGLSICTNLTKLMGGEISVISSKGKGSTFSIELPIKTVARSTRTTLEKKVTNSVSNSNQYPYKILVAEDNLINQKLTKAYLKKIGYDCEIAVDGRKAVDMYKENSYSLIFMDMQMPELNGIEAAKEIFSISGNEKPLIVAMTANSFDEDKQACKDAGMIDFISKPFEVEQLAELIENLPIPAKDKSA